MVYYIDIKMWCELDVNGKLVIQIYGDNAVNNILKGVLTWSQGASSGVVGRYITHVGIGKVCNICKFHLLYTKLYELEFLFYNDRVFISLNLNKNKISS